MSRRRFLLLQGPISPFFRRLARRLRSEGHEALTVTFNTGDALLAFGDPFRVAYKGVREEWPAFLKRLHKERGFTDVILYNDCRFYHAVALKILRPLGVRAHVLEEGYFRPRRVTYEAEGVNGYSVFYPCTPERLEEACRAAVPGGRPFSLPTPFARENARAAPKAVRRIFMYAMLYYLAMAFTPVFYPFYRSHRPHHPLMEMVAWFFRWVAYPVTVRVSASRQRRLAEGGRPYALLLLQLADDSQIRVHSPFAEGGLPAIVNHVTESFAAHAPPDMLLAVKNHPLDCGLGHTRQLVRRAAERYGVTDRVVYIDKGHLPTLLRHARMAVTVNSTAGTSALHHRTPLICLGRAIYDCPGLTFQGSLAEFWTGATPPEPVLAEKFRSAVCAKTQLRGTFYTRSGVRAVLDGLFRYRPFSTDERAPDISDPSVTLSRGEEE